MRTVKVEELFYYDDGKTVYWINSVDGQLQLFKDHKQVYPKPFDVRKYFSELAQEHHDIGEI